MKNLIVLIFAIAFLTACNKHQTIYTPVDGFTKSMFNWQKGSHWLMKDSLTGQIDSFVVDSFETTIENGSYNFAYEYVYFFIEEYGIGSTTKRAKWYVGLDAEMQRNEIARVVGGGVDSIGDIQNFLPCLSRFSDFQFNCNANDYSHVYFNSTFSYKLLNRYLSVYINQAYGLIKLDANLDNYRHVWELIR
ncbi:MAG: hypothetical protein ABI378_14760 [Chitinophagaceae bacterium]